MGLELATFFSPLSISSIILATLVDTDNSRTFSPELEVGELEGEDSSPDARNLEAACERVVTTSIGTHRRLRGHQQHA